MTDVLRARHPAAYPAATTTRLVPGGRSRLALELRELAQDMVGRLDRDELTPDEETQLSDLLDEAVAAVLPQVGRLLEAELAPGVEALPVHARVALAGARRRRLFGVD